MNKRVMLFSNSNFFSVLGRLFLKEDFDCSLFHLRCLNESMSKEEHYVFQLKELGKEKLVSRGILNSVHEFQFSERLCERISRQVELFQPDMAIVELKTMDQTEFQLIHFLAENFNFPITVYNDFVTDSSIFTKLDSLGIKGCVWAMDKSLFIDTVKFHLNSPNS